MRTHLIAFSILSVLVYLAWFGYHYASALGSAFGNVNPALGPSNVNGVLAGVALATVACIAGALLAPAGIGKLLVLFPLVLVAVGQGYFTYSERSNLVMFEKREAAAEQARREELEALPRDFVLAEEAAPSGHPFAISFLMRDAASGYLFRVDVGQRSEISRISLGRFEGDRLHLFGDAGTFRESFYANYRNERGESLFDLYEVRFAEGHSAAEP